MHFTNDTLIGCWQAAGFRIELHHSPRSSGHTHTWVGYRLIDEVWAARTGHHGVIFTGDDLGVNAEPFQAPATARALGAFLSLQPGDVDERCFARYSSAQVAWRDARAATLGGVCADGDLEEITGLTGPGEVSAAGALAGTRCGC